MGCDWIEIPGGTFWMGGGPRDNENPRHEVRVRTFRLARAQVTREEYQRFLDETGHPVPPFWHEPAFAHPR
ncbi:MAG: formylglycine-generating enzyme family protein, partial [Thermoanaerobaculia bacterium]